MKFEIKVNTIYSSVYVKQAFETCDTCRSLCSSQRYLYLPTEGIFFLSPLLPTLKLVTFSLNFSVLEKLKPLHVGISSFFGKGNMDIFWNWTCKKNGLEYDTYSAMTKKFYLFILGCVCTVYSGQ